MEKGRIVSINSASKKGMKKKPAIEANLDANGIKGDCHSGKLHRQVSLLSVESIEKVNRNGLSAGPGDFAENITTRSLRLEKLKVGDIIKVGREAELEVTQIGKDCIKPCSIYYQIGSCIMPREGVFCRVIKAGYIKLNDPITFNQSKKDDRL